MNWAKHVLTRHWHLVVLTASLIVIFLLVYALRGALFPFFLGFVLVYLLLPVITWIEKRLPQQGRWLQTKRVSIIILCYAVTFVVLGFFGFLVFSAVSNAFATLIENAPQYLATAVERLQQWTESLRQLFPQEIRERIDYYVQETGKTMLKSIDSSIMNGISLIPTTVGMLLGMASMPLFLFYILKDREKLTHSFYSSLPQRLSKHVRNIMSILENVLGRYIRALLLLGFAVGLLDLIGLLVLQIPFAPVLAIFAGATELIPTLGPWIGATVAVVVTLAVAPQKVIWVAILFLTVQLLEASFLVPRIHAGYMKMHPATVIVLLVLGAYVAGFWGLVLAVPLTASIVEIYKYVNRIATAEDGATLPLP